MNKELSPFIKLYVDLAVIWNSVCLKTNKEIYFNVGRGRWSSKDTYGHS